MTQQTEERWTTAEVARLSGVTSRTLRHYDAVGLLRPVGTAPNGQRAYGRDELLRLQQVLVLRELGVGLGTIAEMLDDRSGTPRADRLREHHAWLLAERDRFDRLARTVASTIESLEGGTTMPTEQMYEGFDHRRYEAEARERWGDGAVDRSNRSWEQLSDDERAAHQREGRAVSEGLAALLAAGTPADDPATRDLVARHHAWVALFWTPDPAAYRGLGSMYVDDARFTATYDAVAPGLAAYLRDAIHAHADDVAAG
ncbi:MerR family transcriptional regulator [Cellulomonas hominis]|jgi:DNA-binding transcriptional MerR regulator|uniref:DNA-binding transcriptional MerR regulator n=1 Tax=Cellulomonas hominis TaxID=156981 RepID=A0A511FHM8_9CELL|nr:MerR family transcriptional regulator [Cellulomonas hominis]MBB5471683.1 DNA-binding transcriptional MerR regulator [Cellulomonas hominis]MBU5423579.1 MerR family transcriptional regulator [Cellulomonas hominis]NKY10207.1 MerR family transcriptional regulator [Cellulomonas hominis]GEL48751.1 MerR family transcriptional regulator [Cellulomonas hominis]